MSAGNLIFFSYHALPLIVVSCCHSLVFDFVLNSQGEKFLFLFLSDYAFLLCGFRINFAANDNTGAIKTVKIFLESSQLFIGEEAEAKLFRRLPPFSPHRSLLFFIVHQMFLSLWRVRLKFLDNFKVKAPDESFMNDFIIKPSTQ